ncbi:EF-P lysine aminoacylase EpmA [Hyphomicrobium sp. LHD-15]|uniref:EF-P lysine aminoacylase EpmA n=1 Tax=Hyphomicrobium sp. LHD-15 TaxID=3072142 RepID=UPI00280DC2D4|nr:EF-P lysine aminoacylase EpmA [Hyphomicrobium sp. LHD-15]MDQ8697482.1 EF-P lysine aminoacylase EpmA [Hyphomicrobium sp. LHD-15]
MPSPSPWWDPERHRDRRAGLMLRNRIKARIRAWFEAQGFVEVDPAALQVSPGNETHLHAFATELVGTALDRQRLYLHTSPEFAMKKLLAAGEERIFAFAPVYRNRERGALHSPEFTMLEWYRAGAPYTTLWDDCEALLGIAADVTQRHAWSFRGREADIGRGLDRITLDEAFRKYAGFPLLDTCAAGHGDRDALASRVQAAGIRTAADDTWSDLFSRVLLEKIEPHLGSPRPTILAEYPAPEAALARPVPGRPEVAERFELYVAGVELANGFGELGDADEQRRRLIHEMDEKARLYGERYPIDEDFLAALAQMPAASGCALGFDRLVMLATGASSVDQVIWTPLGEGSK